MVQEFIIFAIFLLAALYIGRMLYRSFSAKSGCAKGCGSACSSIDFHKIQKDITAKTGNR